MEAEVTSKAIQEIQIDDVLASIRLHEHHRSQNNT